MDSKVFLRNREQGQYYAGPTGWSRNSSAAYDFSSVESASKFANSQKLVDLEVVLHYDDPVCELVLPVRQKR